SAPRLRVTNPPAKPLMLFDGTCHFCKRWIERLRETTGERVDYATSQEAGANYPQIPHEEFDRAVQLIETDGQVYAGAEAFFHSLGYSARTKWLKAVYENLPGFSPVVDSFYSFIARHRELASKTTRLFWGDDVRSPTYFAARRGFLKTLGLIYLFAFISVWVQIDGLMGEKGITPAREILSALRQHWDGSMISLALQHPTFCWIDSSDAMLHALCLVGVVASALLTFGLVPVPALLVCFACYLSLIVPGDFFFSYQWDILLLETGFLALFLAPWQWRLRRGRDAPVSKIGLLLIKLLLFKLMFMSGVVKLTSGDPCWGDLSALDFHYWTQPLPTIFAWFADKNPDWLKKASVAITLFIEIVVPFFIWGPRRIRLCAAALLIALQIAIALTGNYCFFNLLAIALCLVLIDDTGWAPRRARETAAARRSWPTFVPAAALILTLPINLWLVYTAIKPLARWPRALGAIYEPIEPFHIANGYGLFRVMTKERPEIIFEGSADAMDWTPYEFKWKPGDVKRAPQWNAPHQPRLDWSMWFAAIGSRRDAVVAERLAACLLRNEPAVLALLARNPFPDKPPQFVRASVYQYRFTTSAERKESGDWWKRRLSGEYLPALSPRDFVR
ncbi:MAG: lipase maturation factor family protein, partial [Chthoniobacterales bacterium]